MTIELKDFLRSLIWSRSITPEDDGAQALLAEQLASLGFSWHHLRFSGEGGDDVHNLYARLGGRGPHLCFAGHTDVVPPGDGWSSDPFAAEEKDGVITGRGVVDMKGGIVCFVMAVSRYLESIGGAEKLPGSISFLITGDEEGPAVNGTTKVVDWMAARGEVPDACIVGEPSSSEHIGDTLKVGRRGSLNGRVVVYGTQGHSAYVNTLDNPLDRAFQMIAALRRPLDRGTRSFQASTIALTSVDTGNPAYNVVPGEVEFRFNCRFNEQHTAESLQTEIKKRLAEAAGEDARYEVEMNSTAECFLTSPGIFRSLISEAVKDVTGQGPAESTTGGTSDARFIHSLCPVVELGLKNATIHQVDEQAPVEDLHRLIEIYQRILEKFFGSGADALPA